MKRMARCWIIGLLAACGLPQAQAENVTLGTMHTEGPARNAVWLSDGCPTAEIVQCSGTGDACESVADGCCDPCRAGGGLFGGGGLLGREVGGETPWSLWAWAGPTYGSSAAASLFGFAEGLNVGYRATEGVGLYGSIGFNHDSHSTQILGTVGVQKFGNPDGDGLLERSNVWVLWDQATETQTDMYLTQLRFVAGYALGERSEVGMMWSIPTGGQDIGGVLSPLGGPGYLSSSSSYVGPYAKRRFGQTDVMGTIGYSQGGESVALGLGAERAVTDRANVYVDFKAGDEVYAGSVGMSFGRGRMDTKWYAAAATP